MTADGSPGYRPAMGNALRPATAADARTVAALFRTSRELALPYLPVLHTRDDDLWFFGRLIDRGAVTVAVDDADRAIGFVGAAPGWVEHLYVDPNHQGQGVGSALLAATKSAQPEGLDLWAFQRNSRARRFYERRGFRAVRFTDGAANEERTPDVLYRWPGISAGAP